MDVNGQRFTEGLMRPTSLQAKPDTVDANLEIWARELPELDLETEGIIERIHRLERLVRIELQVAALEQQAANEREVLRRELQRAAVEQWAVGRGRSFGHGPP